MEPTILTLSSVGQITIPRKVRKLLNLEKGAKLELEVDQEAKKLTIKKQKTHEEIFAELEEFHKTLPKPADPRTRTMTVGEMSLELAKNIKGDTWV